MTSSTSQTMTLTAPDGRRVAVDVRGPDDGPVVLLAPPAPGSRRLDPDPAATAAAGVRLVTLDRPGYGGSDPAPGRQVLSVADAADDAALALEAVGGGPALAAGWSAGGRVAMALAARRPELVRGVAVLATPAPHEEVPWIADDLVGVIAHLATDVRTAVPRLEGMLAEMAADGGALDQLTAGSAADERVVQDDDVGARLQAMLAEGYRQGSAGLAADIASYTLREWGFDPRSVGAPVRAWYGLDDTVVSPAHGRWWVDQVADGSLTEVPDVGHLVAVTAWADVLAWGATCR